MKQQEVLKWIILIAIIYIFYKLLKNFTQLFGGGTGGGLGSGIYDLPTDSDQKELDKYINQLNQSPTISDSMASSYADVIYQENQSFNTNEEEIYKIFERLKNNPDLLLLKIKFGTRRPQFGVGYMGLSAFLRSDLNDSEIQKINDILTTKNINTI